MRRSLRCARCDHPNLLHIPMRDTREEVHMALFCRSGYLRGVQPAGVRTSWICLSCGEVRLAAEVAALADDGAARASGVGRPLGTVAGEVAVCDGVTSGTR